MEELTEQRCEAVAKATPKYTWYGVATFSVYTSGCMVYDGAIYFNRQSTTHECGYNGYNCLCKKGNNFTPLNT